MELNKIKIALALLKPGKGLSYYSGSEEEIKNLLKQAEEKSGLKRVADVLNTCKYDIRINVIDLLRYKKAFLSLCEFPKLEKMLRMSIYDLNIETTFTIMEELSENKSVNRFLDEMDLEDWKNIIANLSKFYIKGFAKQSQDPFVIYPYMSKRDWLHTLVSPTWKRWYAYNLGDRISSIDSKTLYTFGNGLYKEKTFSNLSEYEVYMLLNCYSTKGDAAISYMRELQKINLSGEIERSKFFDDPNADFANMAEYLKTVREVGQVSEKNLWKLAILLYLAKGNKKFMKKLQNKVKAMDGTEDDKWTTLLNLPVEKIFCIVYDRPLLYERIAYPDRYLYKEEMIDGTLEITNVCYDTASVIVTALLENKTHFLRVLEDPDCSLNSENLKYLDYSGVIMLINLNAWSGKELKEVCDKEMLMNQLAKEDRVYSYNECKVLFKITKTFDRTVDAKAIANVFHSLLENLRSEDACIRTNQYINAKVTIDEDDVPLVAEKLEKMDLPSWNREFFKFPCDSSFVARYLPIINDFGSLLKETNNETEARFILNNQEICKGKENLEECMKLFLAKDKEINNLKDWLNLPDSFYEENAKTACQFFLDGGARYAWSYRNSFYDINDNALRIVIKAALSGKLPELRYLDLKKECCTDIPDWLLNRWKQDDSFSINGLTVYEDTTFSGIMKMGSKPIHTCMDYLNGQRNICLLSYFDGNKKILYAKSNNHIVGRAVLRLTKAVDGKVPANALNNDAERLHFTDVTEERKTVKVTNASSRLVVFLERTYTPHQLDKRYQVENAFINFVQKKFPDIEIVISSDYVDTIKKGREMAGSDLEYRALNVFITKSKAGIQYLDSFGGTFDSSMSAKNHENCYVKCYCYVQEPHLEKSTNL